MNSFEEKICPECKWVTWYEWSLSVRSYPDCFKKCGHCGAHITDVPGKKCKKISGNIVCGRAYRRK